ncbi:MAG: phage tail tip lysozyme [Nitrososphaera sp.]|nr:phage tail tip lysozyme [Nitrososphaera sp.]
MESDWNGIGVKTGAGGVGDVTLAEKNGNIANAVDAWLAMGLTQQQIAFGVATMGVESGFNPNAQAATTTAYGLGQFTDSTWDRAVTSRPGARLRP